MTGTVTVAPEPITTWPVPDGDVIAALRPIAIEPSLPIRPRICLLRQRVIVRRDCGLPDGKSFHDLRHLFASTLIFAGASVPMVAQYLGHKSPAVTLDVYAHLWPGDDERARDAVDMVLVRDQCGTGNRTGSM
ncbi:tyrosine-type recombinase/integrase [Rhodococcus sp. AG1013]|uniref:tyrosine-type recombinase/integrase n=1 Tax=unclassified Rhodococcus (in: high G+C Gram-positive bacteria) TaxID=192944 RepID=UPI000E0B64EA|nr:tyrosine-type recombinase/integrase [Rhodococcus sp. AG1013]